MYSFDFFHGFDLGRVGLFCYGGGWSHSLWDLQGFFFLLGVIWAPTFALGWRGGGVYLNPTEWWAGLLGDP